MCCHKSWVKQPNYGNNKNYKKTHIHTQTQLHTVIYEYKAHRSYTHKVSNSAYFKCYSTKPTTIKMIIITMATTTKATKTR